MEEIRGGSQEAGLSSPGFEEGIAWLARVPEHSLPLMMAMSGGKPFRIDYWLFYAAEDWLMAIAYPLDGQYGDEGFERALGEALRKTGASACFAIGPRLPARFAPSIVESDHFHVLSVNARIPGRLLNQAKKASERLTVREGAEFTAAHRRLWAEFMQRSANGSGTHMNSRVAALYARAPRAVAEAGGNLRLLDALDENGNIAASLLLDYWPRNFTSYVLGARSTKFQVPHASDLLFAEMLERGKAAGKRFIQLGLGVNDGILRFKRKWGAKPSWPFVMAQWEENGEKKGKTESVTYAFAKALLASPGISARQAFGDITCHKPYAMLWRVEKNNRVSWLGGTAHFFCYSFEYSFRKLFSRVDNVIFEGPLDADFMAKVNEAGKTLPAGFTPLADLMSEEEIRKLERVALGPGGRLARGLGLSKGRKIDVRWLLRHARPWHAFFTLWTAFLERRGWRESVDMEAWRIAHEMGKNVIGMENLEEQLESLGSLPVERVLRFFRACGDWKRRARNNRHAYLAGDLEKMMGSSAEFPTRTEHVVGRRDQRFRERMRPWLEKGNAAVFVGTAHLVNLRHMLAEDGFIVTQAPFGIWPKLHLRWRSISRPDAGVTWRLPGR